MSSPAEVSGSGQSSAIVGVRYDVIRANPTQLRPMGLCSLVEAYAAGAALYRVDTMTGVTEASGPKTYIRLELLSPWSPDAPEKPMVQINGGPASDGTTLAWDVDLRTGEEVGVLLTEPAPDSEGYYRLFPLGLFHDVGDGYTNGQLFAQERVSADELGAMIGEAFDQAGSPDCPDIQPEVPEAPEPSAGDVPGPELIGADAPAEGVDNP